jgi:uncharacterized DUF497 family protein
MVKPRDRVKDCTGFEWDEGNATKNWEKHDVSQSECEQIFFNKPLIFRRDSAHSETESRYYVLGKTDSGRLLFVVFTIREKLIRVISARDMTKREEQRYL